MLEYNKKPSKSKEKNANDYIEELSKAGRVYDTINDNKAKFIKIDGNLLTFEIVNLDKPFQINGRELKPQSKPEQPETNQEIVVNFNTFISSMEKGDKYNSINKIVRLPSGWSAPKAGQKSFLSLFLFQGSPII